MVSSLPPRPAGIDCPDWEADVRDPRGIRCRYYGAQGTCQLPVRLMCVEFLKRNPHLASELPDRPKPTPDAEANRHLPMAGESPPPGAVAAPPRALDVLRAPPDAGRVLEAPGASGDGFALRPPDPKPPPKRASAVDAHRPDVLPAGAGAGGDAPDCREVLTPQSLAALAELTDYVELETPELGKVALVARREQVGEAAARCGRALTFADAAALAGIVAAFPGARVTDIRQGGSR